MLRDIAILSAVTMLPLFELRASIPLGIMNGTLNLPLGLSMHGMGLEWWWVFIICVISNALLGIALYPVTEHIVLLLEKVPLFGKFWKKNVMRTQKRIHPYVEKWGRLGVALFVGVPLPGSGTYSGALGAYLLGMSYRSFILANTLGVIIAGIAVTVVVLSGSHIFSWAVSL